MNVHDLNRGAIEQGARSIRSLSAPERRRGQRLRTVYRVARLFTRGDTGLARVRNISDGGLMLSTTMDMCVGDPVRVDLSDSCSLSGKVAWHHGDQCGIALSAPIDSSAVLKRLFEERRAGDARPMRINHQKSVVVESELGLQVATLRDVSQSGLKLAHDGRFTAGLPVKVRLSPELERRGVVRWSQTGLAGVVLTESLSVEELGSMRDL